MKKTKNVQIAVIGLCTIVCLLGFFVYGVFFLPVTKETNDISYYQALSGEIEGECALKILGRGYVYCPYDLPTMSEMGNYQNYRFNYTTKQEGIIFNGDAYILIFNYGEIEYLSAKERLQQRYIIKTDGIEGEGETTLPPQFQMDGFSFQAIDGGYYPKEMLFIGTSDNSREIALIYYYDQDLDYISPSLEVFFNEESGWKSLMGK